MFKAEEQYKTLAATAHKLRMTKKELETLVHRGVIPALVWKDEKGKKQYRFDPSDIRMVMQRPRIDILTDALPVSRKYKPGRMGYALV